MNLHALQQALWRSLPDSPPPTIQHALAGVSQTLVEGIQAFQHDDLPAAQTRIEETLARLLVAMQCLEIDADRAMERVLLRFAQSAAHPRRFVFYGDRLEIRVGDDVRGGWPLYGPDDYESALALARTFGCDITHADSRQLSLFSPHAGADLAQTAPHTRHRLRTLRRRATSSVTQHDGKRPALRLLPTPH